MTIYYIVDILIQCESEIPSFLGMFRFIYIFVMKKIDFLLKFVSIRGKMSGQTLLTGAKISKFLFSVSNMYLFTILFIYCKI